MLQGNFTGQALRDVSDGRRVVVKLPRQALG